MRLTTTGCSASSATHAVAAVRVNKECECSGNGAFILYGFRYREASRPNYHIDLGFTNDFKGWTLWGTAAIRLEAGDASADGLHVTATSSQWESINSSNFEVSPGAEFRFDVLAANSRGGRDSGYFAIIFLSKGNEISRKMLSVDPNGSPVQKSTVAAEQDRGREKKEPPDESCGSPTLANIDARIGEQERRLKDLLANYTELYPDAVAARRAVEELKQQRQSCTRR